MKLPAFTVTDTRILPHPESWRYASVPGFEVLSTAGKSETEDTIDDFLRFQRAVETVWPLETMNAAIPASIILCGHERQFAQFLPADAQAYASGTLNASYEEREMASIVIECDSSVTGATPEGMDASDMSDYTHQLLHQEYVHFILERLGGRTPPWLREGLWRLFNRMRYAGDDIEFPALNGDPNLAARTAGRTAAMAAAEQAGTFLPLSALFTHAAGAADQDDASMSPWQREAYEFVDFCLFGQQQHDRKAFLDFALRVSREPVSETVFARCFGSGYAAVQTQFWGFTGFSQDQGFKIQAPGGGKAAPLPTVNLTEATDAQVGRIKGETLRMAGKLELAHLNLIAPYIRGSRDPELLAALGIEEEAAGHTDRARRFLEVAVAEHTTRARAYVDLARIRLDADLAHPLAPGRRLSVEQMASVLTPLFAGRSQSPPLRETYALIAEVWKHGSITPKAAHLAAVNYGVQLFPYDTDLVCADADLWNRYGHRAEAIQLCQLGLHYADDAQERARLSKLQASFGGEN